MESLFRSLAVRMQPGSEDSEEAEASDINVIISESQQVALLQAIARVQGVCVGGETLLFSIFLFRNCVLTQISFSFAYVSCRLLIQRKEPVKSKTNKSKQDNPHKLSQMLRGSAVAPLIIQLLGGQIENVLPLVSLSLSFLILPRVWKCSERPQLSSIKPDQLIFF